MVAVQKIRVCSLTKHTPVDGLLCSSDDDDRSGLERARRPDIGGTEMSVVSYVVSLNCLAAWTCTMVPACEKYILSIYAHDAFTVHDAFKDACT